MRHRYPQTVRWIVTILVVALTAYIGVDYAVAQIREGQVSGCVRGNALRASVYHFELAAVSARRQLAQISSDPADRRANRAAASHYEHLARRLVEANRPVAKRPGSILTDCSGKAYPDPLPGFFS